MVRHHHERLDGGGYPDGLLGGAIPLGARVIAVADTFDALTSNRPYRTGCRHKKALDILRPGPARSSTRTSWRRSSATTRAAGPCPGGRPWRRRRAGSPRGRRCAAPRRSSLRSAAARPALARPSWFGATLPARSGRRGLALVKTSADGAAAASGALRTSGSPWNERSAASEPARGERKRRSASRSGRGDGGSGGRAAAQRRGGRAVAGRRGLGRRRVERQRGTPATAGLRRATGGSSCRTPPAAVYTTLTDATSRRRADRPSRVPNSEGGLPDDDGPDLREVPTSRSRCPSCKVTPGRGARGGAAAVEVQADLQSVQIPKVQLPKIMLARLRLPLSPLEGRLALLHERSTPSWKSCVRARPCWSSASRSSWPSRSG